MASTTLFAPQVRSVQPAFIYNNGGTVEIYYTLSDFNNYSDFEKIRYKITNPNVASGWGSDSMIKNKEYMEINPKPAENEPISIELNANNFKLFTVNQYYQVQIQLVNGEEVSAWSQATLIRPIPQAILNIDINSDEPILALNRLAGRIKYVDNSIVEAIDTFSIEITDADGQIVYTKPNVKNALGTEFAVNLYDCFLPENEIYTVSVSIVTINGFNITASKMVQIGLSDTTVENFKKIYLSNDENSGGIKIEFQLRNDFSLDSTIQIQRTSEKEDFKSWTNLFEFEGKSTETYKYTDLTIDSETYYRYRIVEKNEENTYIYSTYNSNPLDILTRFEHIYLLGDHQQLCVKYNPAITGFKYVTQESITNSLGGKFPIVRINGDTKYRQFNLSGTLSFNSDWTNLGGVDMKDSRGKLMSNWFREESCSMLFDIEAFIENFTPAAAEKLRRDRTYFEKKFRTIAMNFLTDQKPKLFKGANEETMIVYLSNLSFTPNKQLSRDIWDFSCTVTEICEFNRENLIKYGLDKNAQNYWTLQYILKVMNDEDANGDNVVNFLDLYVPLEETIDYIPVVQAFWKKYSGGR